MKSFFFGTLALLCFMITDSAYAQKPTKAKRYELEVLFKPTQKYMQGKAKIALQSQGHSSVVFFLHGELKVDSVIAQDKKLKFRQASVFYDYSYNLIARKIVINNFSGNRLQVYYSGYFNASKARSPSDYMRIDAQGVFMRGYGYSLWFPMFLADRQDSYPVDFDKVVIKTPQGFTSIFVGQRLNAYKQGNWQVSEWQAKATDLQDVQCTVRAFRILQDAQFLVCHMGTLNDLKNAQGVLQFMKKLSRKYQQYYAAKATTDSFYVMQMPQFGDIASGNISGISTKIWHNFNQYNWPKQVLAHELVHSFVQYPLPQSNPLFALITEGFPSYFHLPVLAELLGENWYQKKMLSIEKSYLYKKQHKQTPRGWKVPTEKPMMEIKADEISHYKDVFILSDRVILFFNFLRQHMGKERFYKFAQRLFQQKPDSAQKLIKIIHQFMPDKTQVLKTWLLTNDYAPEWKLNK